MLPSNTQSLWVFLIASEEYFGLDLAGYSHSDDIRICERQNMAIVISRHYFVARNRPNLYRYPLLRSKL